MFRDPRILCGPPCCDVPYHNTLGKHLLDVMLSLAPSTPALINGDTDEVLTYGQLIQKSINVANALKSIQGVEKGDSVAFCSENRFEYTIASLAIFYLGGKVVNINFAYTTDELLHALDISKPKYMFCSSQVLKGKHSVLSKLPHLKAVIVFGEKVIGASAVLFSDLEGSNVNIQGFEPEEMKGDDVAVINFSSGTTGLPKGVQITQLNLIVNTMVFSNKPFLERLKVTKILTVIPWFHAYGSHSVLCYLFAGRTIIFQPRFILDNYLRCIQKYKPDILLAVPPIVVTLAKSPLTDKFDLSSVKRIYVGGASTSKKTIEELMKRLKTNVTVSQGFGMTELTLSVTFNYEEYSEALSKSVGKLHAGVKVKVVNPETEEILGPNESGELRFKGGTVMKGYIGSVENPFDKDGYLKTGDVGYYDEKGYLFIVDRIKELIKYKGFQVAPAELEGILLEHPGVLDGAVVGKPDELAGELPMAFVVLKPGVETNEKDIVQFVASKLSSTKHLRGGVVFVEAIPKNPSGKILRRELKKMVQDLIKKKSKL